MTETSMIQNHTTSVNPLAVDTLTRVACIPIYFASHIHYDCQHNKERDRAHEQRIILLPQSDVKKQVNTRQSGADHECAHAASEEKVAIPRDQQRRCHRRDQVSPTESDKFRNRQQQEVK